MVRNISNKHPTRFQNCILILTSSLNIQGLGGHLCPSVQRENPQTFNFTFSKWASLCLVWLAQNTPFYWGILLGFFDIITGGIYSISLRLRCTFYDVSTTLKTVSGIYNSWLHVQTQKHQSLSSYCLCFYWGSLLALTMHKCVAI